jgi:hypothetical protein
MVIRISLNSDAREKLITVLKVITSNPDMKKQQINIKLTDGERLIERHINEISKIVADPKYDIKDEIKNTVINMRNNLNNTLINMNIKLKDNMFYLFDLPIDCVIVKNNSRTNAKIIGVDDGNNFCVQTDENIFTVVAKNIIYEQDIVPQQFGGNKNKSLHSKKTIFGASSDIPTETNSSESSMIFYKKKLSPYMATSEYSPETSSQPSSSHRQSSSSQPSSSHRQSSSSQPSSSHRQSPSSYSQTIKGETRFMKAGNHDNIGIIENKRNNTIDSVKSYSNKGINDLSVGDNNSYFSTSSSLPEEGLCE